MQIDWITVTAQLVNFLILVYLLKRFLYARVLAAIARRQRRIDEQLDQAARREADASRVRQQYEQRISELDLERSARLARAERDAHSQRAALLDSLREEMAHTRSHWHQAMQREQQRFVNELSAESAELTVDMARRVIADLADTSLEERVVDRFIASLETLDPQRRDLIRSAPEPVVVHTGFPLDAAQRKRIEAALERLLAIQGPLHFARTPQLICGVELVAGHARVGWNVASYLKQLEGRVQEVLARYVSPGAAAGASAAERG